MSNLANAKNKEDNEQLIRAIQNGEDRFEEFVENNYGLISKVAYYYSTRTLLEYDDLFNRFLFVAWKCILSYNFQAKFSTMFYKSCYNEVAKIMESKQYQVMKRSFSLHKKVDNENGEEMIYLDLIESPHGSVSYEQFLKEYCTKTLEERMGTFKTQVATYYLFEDKTLKETTEHFGLQEGRASRYKNQAREILKRKLKQHWL